MLSKDDFITQVLMTNSEVTMNEPSIKYFLFRFYIEFVLPFVIEVHSITKFFFFKVSEHSHLLAVKMLQELFNLSIQFPHL